MTEVFFRLVERRTGRKFAVSLNADLPSDVTWLDHLAVARELSAKAIRDGAATLAGKDNARSEAEYDHLLTKAMADIGLCFPAGIPGNPYKIGIQYPDAAMLPAAVVIGRGRLADAQFSHAWWNSEVDGVRVTEEAGVLLSELDARFEAMEALTYDPDPAEAAKGEVEKAFLDLLTAAESGDLAGGLDRAREFAADRGLRLPENSYSR